MADESRVERAGGDPPVERQAAETEVGLHLLEAHVSAPH